MDVPVGINNTLRHAMVAAASMLHLYESKGCEVPRPEMFHEDRDLPGRVSAIRIEEWNGSTIHPVTVWAMEKKQGGGWVVTKDLKV